MSDAPFLQAFRGRFTNMLRWEQLDALWDTLRQRADRGWYVYAIGENPPGAPLNGVDLNRIIGEIDALLRREHQERYCGIVYVDEPAEPSFIKIYDPNNLGSVCGSSGVPPPLPGWTLSLLPPVDLHAAMPPPNNRRRWWRRLLGGD